MKTKYFIIFNLIATPFVFKAQTLDTLFKRNGEKIGCKVLEIGTNAVSYKKTDQKDAAIFTDSKSDILQIKYMNGKKEEFPQSIYSQDQSGIVKKESQSSSKSPVMVRGKALSADHKIVMDGKKFYLDGTKLGRKDVDRVLSQSDNPAVPVVLKVAKLTKKFQKAASIISWPSTISGGIASFSTFRTVYLESQAAGGVSMGSWVNAGLSFVGTLTMPVTSKILKKKRDKLYAKTIDLYNIGKQ